MLFFQIILWILATVIGYLFFSLLVIPYVKHQILLWQSERIIRKMSRQKYLDEQTKRDLTKLADNMKDARKNQRMEIDLDDELP